MVPVIDWQQYLATVDEGLRQQYLASIDNATNKQQQYLATSKESTRFQRIAECRRFLLLSDRRLLVLDPRGGLMSGVIPLSAIGDVSVGKPRLKPIAHGEATIRIEHSAGPDGLRRVVEYSGPQNLVGAFAERLRRNAAAVRLAAFESEHESIALDDRERFVELLKLKMEAGEYEVPAVVPSPDGDSLLPPPVASARRCPICQKRLRKVSDAVGCRNCHLVWCDPSRQPVTDDAGKIIGTEFFLFFDTNYDERDVVHCFRLTKDEAI
jgi:hypothetical protein